jgi:hypothetical protein
MVRTISSNTGELLAPVAAEAMEECTVSEDVGATAGDSDDSLQQSPAQLLETIDEPLTHEIAGDLDQIQDSPHFCLLHEC